MIRTHSLAEFNKDMQTVVTIGTFDGVHLGHQKIIAQLVQKAKELDLPSVVLTFFPHPRMVLQQDSHIKMLQSIDERAEKLAALGVDYLMVHPFTKEFSRMHAQDFVSDILVHGLHAKHILIGYDHRFGRNRNANIEDLRRYGNQFDFEVSEISAREIDAMAVSSTKIRKALEKGNVQKAAAFLGASYTLNGKVISGKKIGRSLGFPTANMQPDFAQKLIPKEGVYVVLAHWKGSHIYGMLNIGQNPTIVSEDIQASKHHPKIEVHLFDFSKDLYDQTLSISFLKRLREEEKFPSLDQLKAQLALDKKNALSFISRL